MMKNWLSRLFGASSEMSATADAALPCSTQGGAAMTEDVLSLPNIDLLFQAWLLDAGGMVDAPPNEAEKRFLRALERAAALDEQELATLVPRVPAVVPALLQSLRDKNVSNAELSARIEEDMVLVAEVIRQANSSYYRRATPITGIEQALAVLGQNGLRQLVARVAFKPVISNHNGHFTRAAAPRIWNLSKKCAIAGRCLAAQRSLDPFESFLAGLVQNVGALVALRVMDRSGDDAASIHTSAFCSAFFQHARQLSFRIGRQWDLPASVLQAIGEQTESKAAMSLSPLGEVLHAADRLARIGMLANEGRLADQAARQAAESIEGGTCCYEQLNSPEADHPDA